MADSDAGSVDGAVETTQDFWKEIAKESKEFIPRESLKVRIVLFFQMLITMFYFLAFIIFFIRFIIDLVFNIGANDPGQEPDLIKWPLELMMVLFLGVPPLASDVLGFIATTMRTAYPYAFFYWTHILLLVYFFLLVLTSIVFMFFCVILEGVLMKSFPYNYPGFTWMHQPLRRDPICFHEFFPLELVLIIITSIIQCLPTLLVVIIGNNLRRNLFLARINKTNAPF